MAAVSVNGYWPVYNPQSRLGPYQDGSGNLWAVLGASSGSSEIRVRKSTDGGATWDTSYDTSTSNALTAQVLDSVFDATNGIIYVATLLFADNTIRIYSFTISNTTWARVDTTTGPATTSTGDSNSNYPLFLNRRSTGEFVVAYQGPTHSYMGGQYRSVYYVRCSSTGTWSAEAELDAGGGTSYDCRGAVLGASDRVHMFYNASTTATHRSLDSSNTLDTASGAFSGYGAEQRFACYYDPTLAKIVIGPHNPSSTTAWVYRADSTSGPTFNQDTNSAGAISRTAPEPVAFIYEPAGGKLYMFYRDSTSSDVYQNSTDTTTWTTANAALQDACTANTGISVGLITNAIGVLFQDTNVYFDKLTLAAGPITKTGKAVSEFAGAGDGAWTIADTGAGVAPFTGTADGRWTVNRAGVAVSPFAGGGTATKTGAGTTYTKQNLSISPFTGHGADVDTAADTGRGETPFTGRGADASAAAETGYALSPLAGHGADAAVFAETILGVAALTGGGGEQKTTGGATYIETGMAVIGP